MLRFPLQFAQRETYPFEGIWMPTCSIYIRSSLSKNARSTHIATHNLSLHFLYEFTAQIVVHVAETDHVKTGARWKLEG